jgi:FSR family fosmidomycin resistance protein-like MFS transporter
VSEPRSRNLWAACLAHAIHDGYTDALYAFLPVWQTQFRLSYAGVATLRALYYGTMGGLQIPVDQLLKPLSSRWVLALSTLIAAAGYLILALPGGFAGLCFGLVAAGIGSSMQHPRGSLLVSQTYGSEARGPLGIYNFSGDLGKAILPALAAMLLPALAWRSVVGLMAALGLVITLALLWLAPRKAGQPGSDAPVSKPQAASSGFHLLALIGAMDTATRMGYLLFLPFLIQARGGTSATVGLALALLFLGGALGKATCSWLAGKLGVVGSVLATEGATALLIAATLFTPLRLTLWLLPLLGVVLNGTSSVLYGCVPDLAPDGDTGRAFAVFYTCVIGSGGLAPILYGAVADHTSQTAGILAAAATAAAITPLLWLLRPHLKEVC